MSDDSNQEDEEDVQYLMQGFVGGNHRTLEEEKRRLEEKRRRLEEREKKQELEEKKKQREENMIKAKDKLLPYCCDQSHHKDVISILNNKIVENPDRSFIWVPRTIFFSPAFEELVAFVNSDYRDFLLVEESSVFNITNDYPLDPNIIRAIGHPETEVVQYRGENGCSPVFEEDE